MERVPPGRPVHVTRSLQPQLEAYAELLRPVFESGQFTNDGPLVHQLEDALTERLEVAHGVAVASGTLAIQLACSALDVKGEVITSPLSFVATASALAWMGLDVVFGDIDSNSLTLDPERCAEQVTSRTAAIVATHVYGFPCDVAGLEAVAREHGLPLIYDAAHAFDCRWDGRPLVGFGDASALSFHATKTFHTAEGGFVCTPDDEVARRCRSQRNFGFDGLAPVTVPGINAKMSELHAALGLAVLPLVDAAREGRRERFEQYLEELGPLGRKLRLPLLPPGLDYNYAYFPVVFPDEASVVGAWLGLTKDGIFPRRYFDPPLNRLPYTGRQAAPVAEELCPRLLCLPLFDGLEPRDVSRIASVLRRVLK